MRRIKKLVRLMLPILLITLGIKVIAVGTDQEVKFLEGYQLYNAATVEYNAAIDALKDEDVEKAVLRLQNACPLYMQSGFVLEDRDAKAVAFYEAANACWLGKLADFQTLVNLYQQSIRYRPGFYEAAWNLEYLYWLRANNPEKVPKPGSQKSDDKPKPGSKPGQGGPSSGDI